MKRGAPSLPHPAWALGAVCGGIVWGYMAWSANHRPEPRTVAEPSQRQDLMAAAAACASGAAKRAAEAELRAWMSTLSKVDRLREIRQSCLADARSERVQECDKARVEGLVKAAPPADAQEVAAAASAQIVASEKVNRRIGRHLLAKRYEEALLAKHMNPDGVSLSGPDETTMTIEWWACSRQWTYDFEHSEWSKEVVETGIKLVVCQNAIEQWRLTF